MKHDTWLWRGIVLVVVVLTIMTTFLAATDERLQQLAGQVQDVFDREPVSLEASLIDDALGIVEVVSQFHPQRFLNGVTSEQLRFPLRIEQCFFADVDLGEQLLGCVQHSIANEETFPTPLVISERYLLPNERSDLIFRTRVEGFEKQADAMSSIDWKPIPFLRSVQGVRLNPQEALFDVDAVIAVSRIPDVDFFFDQQQLNPQLVVEPQMKQEVQRLTQGDIPLFTWLIPLPAELDPALEHRLCLQAGGEQSCYFVERSLSLVPNEITCGNGVIDAHEDCDDGIAGSDYCSPQCTLIDQQRQLYPQTLLSFESLQNNDVLLFAQLVESSPAQLDRQVLIRIHDELGQLLVEESMTTLTRSYVQILLQTQGTIEVTFILHTALGEELIERHVLDLNDPALFQQGPLRGSAPTDSLIDEVQKHESSVLQNVSLSEFIEVYSPARLYQGPTVYMSGKTSYAHLETCLLSLDDGSIYSGAEIAVDDSGLFMGSIIPETLAPGEYAVLFFEDVSDTCEERFNQWVAVVPRDPLPLLFRVEEGEAQLDVLELEWESTSLTEIDIQQSVARDLSPSGNEFLTELQVTSSFVDDIEVRVVFVDDDIQFSSTIAPQSKGRIRLPIDNFSYGAHRMLVFALLPDGQRTADVLIPFDYVQASFMNRSVGRYQVWQVLAIVLLIVLGGVYVIFRVSIYRMRRPHQVE